MANITTTQEMNEVAVAVSDDPAYQADLDEQNVMMLDRNSVVRLAEEHHLAITIRPDGQITGLHDHLLRLRGLLEASRREQERNAAGSVS